MNNGETMFLSDSTAIKKSRDIENGTTRFLVLKANKDALGNRYWGICGSVHIDNDPEVYEAIELLINLCEQVGIL